MGGAGGRMPMIASSNGKANRTVSFEFDLGMMMMADGELGGEEA